jgi:hypothetical protein
VLGASPSNTDDVVLWDKRVTSTEPNRPTWTKWAFLHLENDDLQGVFL